VSRSPVSTIGKPVSLAGSSTAPGCQPAPIVPSEFEPHTTPMPVPLPAPRVPPGFPPRAAPAPSTPRITAADGPTGCQGGQTAPYTKPGGQTAPYTEAGGPTTPLAVQSPPLEVRPPRGPPLRLLLRPAWVHHRAPGRRRRSPTPVVHNNLRHRRPRLHLTARPRPYP
jgi:hypothetical protein